MHFHKWTATFQFWRTVALKIELTACGRYQIHFLLYERAKDGNVTKTNVRSNGWNARQYSRQYWNRLTIINTEINIKAMDGSRRPINEDYVSRMIVTLCYIILVIRMTKLVPKRQCPYWLFWGTGGEVVLNARQVSRIFADLTDSKNFVFAYWLLR